MAREGRGGQEQVRSVGGSVGEVGSCPRGRGQLPPVVIAIQCQADCNVSVCGIKGGSLERSCLCLPGGGVTSSTSVQVHRLSLVSGFAQRFTGVRLGHFAG